MDTLITVAAVIICGGIGIVIGLQMRKRRK